MRKQLTYVVLFMLSIFAISCSSSKETTTDNAADLRKKMFNGTWVLSSVEKDAGLKLAPDLLLFGIADAQCFNSSTWKMISNNNTGTISLVDSKSCSATSLNTVWTVSGDSYNFKWVESRSTAKEVVTGYTLSVLNIDETSMKLKTTVKFLNKDCAIVLNFVKQ